MARKRAKAKQKKLVPLWMRPITAVALRKPGQLIVPKRKKPPAVEPT